jgi:hypothetical protein
MLVFSIDIVVVVVEQGQSLVVAVEQGQSLVNNTFNMLHALTLTHSGDRRNNCPGDLSQVSLRRIGEIHERRTDGGRRARGGHGALLVASWFVWWLGGVAGTMKRMSFGDK